MILPGIEVGDHSIESPGVDGFESRGIDSPLLGRNLQPSQYRRQVGADEAPLVATNSPAGPVDQLQIVWKGKLNSGT